MAVIKLKGCTLLIWDQLCYRLGFFFFPHLFGIMLKIFANKFVSSLTNMKTKNTFDHIYVPKDTLNTPSPNGKAKVSIKALKGPIASP
jgi:hypothetical protein